MRAAGVLHPYWLGCWPEGRSVGGVDDQHVGLGPAGDIGGNRAMVAWVS